MLDRWLAPWPKWAGRWYGIAVRVLVGGIGTLLGLGLVWLANFGASFKRTQPEWDSETIAGLVIGVATIIEALALSMKPSRLTVALAIVVIVTLPIFGLIV